MSEMAIETAVRRFTVDEYHRMAEAGVLRSEERVELLDGVCVEMSPIGHRHWAQHAAIVRYLNAALGDLAVVAGQASIPLGEWNEPQPDVVVLAPKLYTRTGPPTADDIYAFIELADTSLATDSGLKLRLYAGFAIPDYVVVDLTGNRVHHYSLPAGGSYGDHRIVGRGETFVFSRLADIEVSTEAFLPGDG